MSQPRKPQGQRSIASDSTEIFLLKGMVAIVGFLAGVLISRGLGPQGRGEYYLPVVAAATVTGLVNLGLEHVNVFLLGTRGLSVNRLSGQNGFVAVSMGGLGILLLLLTPLVIPSLFGDTSMAVLSLAAATVPFSLHTRFSAGLLTLQGKATIQFRAALLSGAIQVVLLCIIFIAGRLNVSSVLSVNLSAVVITWGLTGRALRVPRTGWFKWDPLLLGESLKHSLVLHIGMVFFFLHLRLDMFMVKGMVGVAALGQYSLSVVLAEAILLVTDSAAIAVLPRQMENTVKEAASLALSGARATGVLALVLGCCWVAAGLPIILFCFGPAFAPAYSPLVGLLPGIVFLGMQRMCGPALLRAGRPSMFTTIYALSLFCNGMLNIWWIPTWGIVGAALASSTSYGVAAVLFLSWTTRLAEVSLSEGMVPKRSDIALLQKGLSIALRQLLIGLGVVDKSKRS